MLHKVRQFNKRHQRTSSNRLPNLRSRQFLLNRLYQLRARKPTAPLRAAMGLVRWTVTKSFHKESRVAAHTHCFLTGRGRGLTQRYSVTRTRLRHLAVDGRLFGVRKSSW